MCHDMWPSSSHIFYCQFTHPPIFCREAASAMPPKSPSKRKRVPAASSSDEEDKENREEGKSLYDLREKGHSLPNILACAAAHKRPMLVDAHSGANNLTPSTSFPQSTSPRPRLRPRSRRRITAWRSHATRTSTPTTPRYFDGIPKKRKP